jgi:hypothetical protein
MTALPCLLNYGSILNSSEAGIFSDQLCVSKPQSIPVGELAEIGGEMGEQAADAATQVAVIAVVDEAAQEMLAATEVASTKGAIDSAAEFKQVTNTVVKDIVQELKEQGASSEVIEQVSQQLASKIEQTTALIQRNGNNAAAVTQGLKSFTNWAGRALDVQARELSEAISAIRQSLDPVEISARERIALQKLIRFTGSHNVFNEFAISFGDAYALIGKRAEQDDAEQSTREQLNRVRNNSSLDLGLYQGWWLKLQRGEQL